jgi:hypothetical protein
MSATVSTNPPRRVRQTDLGRIAVAVNLDNNRSVRVEVYGAHANHVWTVQPWYWFGLRAHRDTFAPPCGFPFDDADEILEGRNPYE